MSVDVWLLFCAAAFVNIISPGPAILLAITNGVSSGLKSVAAAALGNICGLFILSSISMFGLGLLLKTSVVLFTALKVIGAAYLIYLGIKRYRNSHQLIINDDINLEHDKTQYLKKSREAFFVAVTNPKAILFFVAFFPIFVNVNTPVLPQFFIMTLTFMALSFMTLMTYGALANTAKHWFTKAHIAKLFHRVTGGIFVGFGVALLQLKH